MLLLVLVFRQNYALVLGLQIQPILVSVDYGKIIKKEATFALPTL